MKSSGAYSFYKIFMNYVTTEDVQKEVLISWHAGVNGCSSIFLNMWKYLHLCAFISLLVCSFILQIYGSSSLQSYFIASCLSWNSILVKNGKESSILIDFFFHVFFFWCSPRTCPQYSGPSKEALAYVTWLKEDSRFCDILVQVSSAVRGHAFPRLKLRHKSSLIQASYIYFSLEITSSWLFCYNTLNYQWGISFFEVYPIAWDILFVNRFIR